MKPLLFLHAGFHKTGTSAVQRLAASNRRLLASQGLLYPRLWPASFRPVDGHHFLAHAVAGNERFMTRSRASRLVGRWRRSAERRGVAVMLSSEAICRLAVPGEGSARQRQELYLRRLRELLDGFEVTPVLVLRRQDDFVRSLYQEHVAEGLTPTASLTFEAFLRDRAADKPQFLSRLRLFQSVFGDIRVLVYEDLEAQGLIPGFFEACGVRLPQFQGLGLVRASLSPAQTLIKQRLNRFIKNRWQNRLLLGWLNTQGIRLMVNEMLGECESIWPSSGIRQEFLEQFEEENSEIGRAFLGGQTRPFPDLESSGSRSGPPSPSRVDEALAALVRGHRRRLALMIGRDPAARLAEHA